jgi:outer membrane immunogenic protein
MKLIQLSVIAAAIGLTPVVGNAADWAGPYAGFIGGAGMATTIVDDYDCNITCGSWNENSRVGFTYGIEGGYNWKLSPSVVVGIEGDISGTTFKGQAYSADWGGGAGHHSKWNALTTLRGRAGVAVDDVLLYVTGGLAVVSLHAYGDYPFHTGYNYDASGPRIGFAIGSGFEYKLSSSPWSIKTEGLYVSTAGKEAHAEGFSADYNKYKVTASATLIRVGANYKF